MGRFGMQLFILGEKTEDSDIWYACGGLVTRYRYVIGWPCTREDGNTLGHSSQEMTS